MWLVKEVRYTDTYGEDVDDMIDINIDLFKEKENAIKYRNYLLSEKIKEILEHDDKIIDENHNIVLYKGEDEDRENIVDEYFKKYGNDEELLDELGEELFEDENIRIIYKVEIDEINFSD